MNPVRDVATLMANFRAEIDVPASTRPYLEAARTRLEAIQNRVSPVGRDAWQAARAQFQSELTELSQYLRLDPERAGADENETAVLAEWRWYFRYAQPVDVPARQYTSLFVRYLKAATDGLKVCERLLRMHPPHSELRFVPRAISRHPQEWLYRDILIRGGISARMAEVEEDIFERTDLRVQLPQLNRRHGARVQLKDVTEPEHFSKAQEAYDNPEEFVFLSPISVAWRLFPHDPNKAREYARGIQFQLGRAMDKARREGVRPVEFVSAEIIVATCEFVREEAIRSCTALREREAKTGSARNVTDLRRRAR